MSGVERRSWASLATIAVIVFGACCLGASFDTWLVFPGTGAAVLFPPYAIVTAALVRTSPRQWWVVLVAASAGDFIPHHVGGAGVEFVLLAELVNHARAVLAAVALRRIACRGETMRQLIAYLAIAVVAAPCISGLGGAWLVTSLGSGAFWLAWQEWSLSNAITGLTLLPILLALWHELAIPRRRRLEAAALAASTVAVCTYVFAIAYDPMHPVRPLHLIVPFLLWAAGRFGFRATSAVVLAVVVLSTWTTMADARLAVHDLVELQLFVLVTSIPVLLLAVRTEQQRRTAAAYQSIVEDQTEMICRFRPDGTCTFANRAFCDAFGRTRDELVGHDLWSLVPAEVRPILGVLTATSPIAAREVSVGARWQQWRDRGLFDDTGLAVEYQVVGRDITDRKRAEDDRRELEAGKRVEATLRDADRRKDEFLAVLGHELRNPLAPLGIATKVLSEAHPETRAASWARESAKRQLDHMTRLLDDLLDISRITLGRIELRLEWFDLRSAIDDAVEVVHAAIESRGHVLAIDVPATPMRVRADRVRVTQVVANLLSNAAKYTEIGGRIEVNVARGQRGIRISVRDDGIGLAPESLEKIFEPFHQLPATGDRVHDGLGIGLTLVRRLVELHGGSVEARSDGLRRGSEMIVYLPQLDEEVSAVAPAAVGADARPLRILAVDDNIDIADGLAEVLNLWGHTVRTANDGVAALEIATAFAPEVVLLDLALPRLDGFEVARRLRVVDRAAVLVAMTGYGVEPTRARVTEAGFHHHIAKPIDLDSLRALLDRATRSEPAIP